MAELQSNSEETNNLLSNCDSTSYSDNNDVQTIKPLRPSPINAENSKNNGDKLNTKGSQVANLTSGVAASVNTRSRNGGTENKQASMTSKKPVGEVQKRYFTNFLNPMLDDMAKHVKKNEEILDQINKKLEDEREKRRKAHLSAHIPEPLKGHGQDMKDIMRYLETMIVCDKYDNNVSDADIVESRISTIDEHGEAAILAYSLAARVQTLDVDHADRLTATVAEDCQSWLTKLFRFKDGNVFYHDNEWDGVVKICRLALHQRYLKYATEGFEALYSRPPVIYISAAAKAAYGHYIYTQLGLPHSCLSVVPCNTVFGSNHKMDVAVFEKLVQDDLAAAKTPLLLIAFAGTPEVGHVDKLERLQEICENNSIWLHVEGSHLATLTMFSVPTSISSAKSGDSLTLRLSSWFGVHSLPTATIYKQVDAAVTQSVALTSVSPSLCLQCLPLWVCLQSLGHEGIVERVKHSCDLAKLLFESLCDIPALKQVSKEKIEKKEDKEISLSSLISKAIHAMLIFEIVSPTVVFKFSTPNKEKDGVTIHHYTLTEDEQQEAEADSIYYDALNAWLCEGLIADNPFIPISLVDVDRDGICIRFAPLENVNTKLITQENIKTFVASVKHHVNILETTVNHRTEFQSLVSQHSKLRCLNKPNWAGLGMIQYIAEDESDINTINTELVHKLKSSDMAFSLGDVDGTSCVRFGLICEGTNLADLVDMVAQYGEEVEEASKYLEKMADMIQKGIDETNKELEAEAENKLRTEGVLRQMPLVGSFVNWWSPPPKDVMIGRSFNMKSGQVKSTQAIYKYHMQIDDFTDMPNHQAPPIDTPSTPPNSPTAQSTSQLQIDTSYTDQPLEEAELATEQ